MKVLLVNLPIYDFAAYDFWMKPLGLLYISSLLKKEGHEVELIDSTYRQDSYYSEVKSDKFGRGSIFSEEVEKPEFLKQIPRVLKRYGLPERVIDNRIKHFSPDVIFVTCTMTYWYLGAIEIKKITDKLSINLELLLGGIYSTLLPEHAKTLGFDNVYTRKDTYVDELDLSIPKDFGRLPAPDHSYYKNSKYGVIASSMGCPFSCPYCVSPILYGKKENKDLNIVIREIEYLFKMGFRKIAFYDDALLFPQERFIELCDRISRKSLPISFFTPNGLHSKFIDKKVALSLKKANFREPRISLETSDFELQKKLNLKTDYNEFKRAVKNLNRAGYKKKNIYTYLLAGIPGQSFYSVKKSIMDVGKVGVKVSLAEFSPIPKTPLAEDLKDPLLTNNTVYFYHKKKERKMNEAKSLVKWINRGVDLGIPIDEIKDYL